MIGGIGNYNPYSGYVSGYSYNAGRSNAATMIADTDGGSVVKDGTMGDDAVENDAIHKGVKGNDDTQVKPGRKSSPAECETCKSRKYQDGSNENVSFKAPTHISPNAAAGAVRAHEGEHVANAYSKAAKDNGKVIRASVSIHTAVCPECGTTYVSGGTTNTMIKYQNEENPYTKNQKSADGAAFIGNIINAAM